MEIEDNYLELNRYAIADWSHKKYEEGIDYINLGDWIQTIAIEELFTEWKMDEWRYISMYDLKAYNGGTIIVPMCGYHSLSNKLRFTCENMLPVSDDVIPVFFSFHYLDNFFPQDLIDQLKKHEPIGCRDEGTKNNLIRHGIEAYVTGCVTSLFQSRSKSDAIMADKLVLIDVSDRIVDFIPTDFKNVVRLSNLLDVNGEENGYISEQAAEEAYLTARERLNYLKHNARLVVTSRLHAASPCMAMGIPVILAREDGFSERYAWIDKYIPLYTKETWNQIDWNPSTIEYEEIKGKMKSLFRKQMLGVPCKKEMMEIDSFWCNRKKSIYNERCRKAIMKLNLSQFGKYVIWGCNEESHVINYILKEVFANVRLSGVYDLNVRGLFDGVEVKTSKLLERHFNEICFVVPITLHTKAKEIFSYYGNKYVLVNMKQDTWFNNLES